MILLIKDYQFNLLLKRSTKGKKTNNSVNTIVNLVVQNNNLNMPDFSIDIVLNISVLNQFIA